MRILFLFSLLLLFLLCSEAKLDPISETILDTMDIFTSFEGDLLSWMEGCTTMEEMKAYRAMFHRLFIIRELFESWLREYIGCHNSRTCTQKEEAQIYLIINELHEFMSWVNKKEETCKNCF